MENNINNFAKYLFDYDKMLNPRTAFVELDLTNFCNKDCKWCNSSTQRKFPKQYMSKEILENELLLACQGKYGMVFTGGGEPTLNPLFPIFVDIVKKKWDSKELASIALVTNGTHHQNIRYFLDKFDDPKRSWVRISLNDEEPSDNLINLLMEYPQRIGISCIYGDENERHKCYKNSQNADLILYSKFIRVRASIDFKNFHEYTTPSNCVGRLFSRVIESNGKQAFCCQSRGYEGKSRFMNKCPKDCRWSSTKEDIEKCWDMNPFT